MSRLLPPKFPFPDSFRGPVDAEVYAAHVSNFASFEQYISILPSTMMALIP